MKTAFCWQDLRVSKFGSSLFRVGNRIVESSVSSPCALCLCGGGSSYPLVITSGERRSTTETQSSQSTHRAPNQELENHSNLRLATGNSEEPNVLADNRDFQRSGCTTNASKLSFAGYWIERFRGRDNFKNVIRTFRGGLLWIGYLPASA